MPDGQEDLEFRDLDNGATTVVTIRIDYLGDEVVAPLKVKLREELTRKTAAGRTSFILNMKQVTMMDSCGLAAIISTKRLLDKCGADLTLTNLSELPRRLFHLTRLDRVISIHETEAEALAAG